ncbi:hypothetical protein N0V88_000370 [Collariella sp. IMI 366227]|nr:hypothetical protein N0V88_000370 [Collariella sp. IMI 366227]
MPVEVISLLSSSEAGSPPPQVATPSSPPARALPATRLDFNLFSSPTLPPPRSKAIQEPSLNARTRTSAPTLTDDPWFISNDELRVSKNGNEAVWTSVSEMSSKRRRLDSYAAADDVPANASRSFRRIQSEVIILDDSDENHAAQQDSDDDLFPDISDLGKSKHSLTSVSTLSSTLSLASASSKPPRKPKSTGTKSASSAPKKNSEEKAREKEEKAAAREEKERKKLEKERFKEKKAQEKAKTGALAEVNKIRTDKKVSTPEMIVDLPTTLDATVKLQAETFLQELDVQSTTWTSPVDNVVKWRRKVRSRYNSDLGYWEPIPERIDHENYAMVIIPAAQFVSLALGQGTASLDPHVLRMKHHFPHSTLIYLIEGLDLWLRKNRTIRNRHFISAVRNGLEPTAPTDPNPARNSQPRRRKAPTTTPTFIDEEVIETTLLTLQILHTTLVHHTTIPLETARWISVFTQHISTAPYRLQRDAANDAGFCMETGQVRTGETPHDTYIRMLQEIGRVTAPIAYGIAGSLGVCRGW